MQDIHVGELVRKPGCSNTGPEAYVTVLEKSIAFKDKAGGCFHAYLVLQPDGQIKTYTDAVLRKTKRCTNANI
jgi:hypothetical protein